MNNLILAALTLQIIVLSLLWIRIWKRNCRLKYANKILKKKFLNEKNMQSQKESFIANLTHDLKSPTSAQISSINLLLDENFGTLTEKQREILNLTKSASKYIFELISTIIDTYKFQRGKIKLNKSIFDLNNLLFNLKRDFLILAKEKNQSIVLNSQKQNVFIYGDRLQLKRVVMNFLTNAITYGDKNSKIIINTKVKGNIVECSVSNKSNTIKEKELEGIFKEFSQTSMSRYNSASSGLGLHLSKQIIEMHNGKIYAKSTKNRTCTFGFKIRYTPIKKQEEVFTQLLKE